jgi:NAD(P)-dependent dehydrogenase (short-subunit alcohol dehydrogenase family)
MSGLAEIHAMASKWHVAESVALGPARVPSTESRAMRLNGKRVLVTGSSRGIGMAIAAGCLAEGATLVVNSRSSVEATRAAQELGGNTVGIGADVGEEAQARRLVQEAAEAMGGLDLLYNNAGFNIVKNAIDMTYNEFRSVIDLDLIAPFVCSQEAARIMIAGGGGSIVNTCSIASFSPAPGRAPYASAKAGLAMLTKILAIEWAEHRVRVNAIAPGFVLTELTQELVKAGKLNIADVERRTPLHRGGTLQEIAKAAVFLGSDDASYVTGETLLVDGGWCAYGWT